jgi:hypothetical protein
VLSFLNELKVLAGAINALRYNLDPSGSAARVLSPVASLFGAFISLFHACYRAYFSLLFSRIRPARERL